MKKFLAIFKYLFFLAIGLTLLWLVYRRVDLQYMIDTILGARYGYLLLSMVFAIISHMSRGMRWNILINSMGYKTNTITTFWAVMMGYFANMALPRLGEVTRCGALNKKSKIPFDALVGTVVAERVFDLIVLILIIVGVIAFQMDLLGDFVNRYIFEGLFARFHNNLVPILIMVGALIVFVLIIRYLHKALKPWLSQFNAYQKTIQFFHGFLDGLKTIYKLKRKSAFMMHTLIIWAMYATMTYIVFFAIDETSHLQWWDGLTVMVIGSLGMVAPVPGGIGTYHFFVKVVLTELYGTTTDAAASWAMLIYFSQGLLIIVLGIISYFVLFLGKDKSHVETGNHSTENI